ncbi:MAG: SHOCT domain-containing protein [Bacilli bacterium]|nr:SHOCT domain-containing protein [Bacilli bacterium]
MIIGGNNNMNKGNDLINNFKNKNPQNNKIKNNFGFTEEIKDYVHTNPTDDITMYDKSIAMLKNRLDNGLITIEEFNRKCEEIGKKKTAALTNKNNN